MPIGADRADRRITPIDVLRGFALLGILVMNIQSFAMIGAAYVNPMAFGDLTGLNYWVWYLSHLFADQKFMSIFSMLFGAGILLMTTRQEGRTGKSATIHYRRMGALLMIGMLHAYLIWYGDILVAYALCGMAAYLFRRLPPRLLLVLGVAALGMHSLIYLGISASMPHWPKEALQQFRDGMSANSAEAAKELAAYRGGWFDQLGARAVTAIFFQTFLFALFTVWRAGGLMLVGMALFKLGVFNASRSARVYWSMVLIGLLGGLPLIMYGHMKVVEHEWDPVYAMFSGLEYNYWGSALVSLGYIGGVMLVCRQTQLARWTMPLAAVGQMALTNYLMQSIICTLFFYGHGFGYFGYLTRGQQLGFVVGVWVFQLVVSPLWLTYFRFGPAEWIWRAMTYGTLPPLLRRDVSAETIGAT